MFCPKCGAEDQNANSYCKRCGEWLPDIESLSKPGFGLFRKLTRPEEKIRKMRIFEAISTGLSLTSAAIIFSFIVAGRNRGLLFLAAISCVVVAVYQIVNFYLGYNLQRRIDGSRQNNATTANLPDEHKTGQLNAAAEIENAHLQSVVDDTTKLLDPVPRKAVDRNS